MNTPRTDRLVIVDDYGDEYIHNVDAVAELERELIAINAEHQKFACHGETLSDTLTRIMGAANKYERELIAEQEKVRELREALEKATRYFADINGCYWIRGDSAGEIDMRQRAKALQSICFDVVKKTK